MTIPVRTTGPRKHADRVWKLEDAKARFSEVVRLAQSQGPQHVTFRGKEAVVVISVEELNRLKPAENDRAALVPFLEGLELDGLPIEREMDRGRNVTL